MLVGRRDEALTEIIYCHAIRVLRELMNIEAPNSSAEVTPEYRKLEGISDVLTDRIVNDLLKNYVLMERESFRDFKKDLDAAHEAISEGR